MSARDHAALIVLALAGCGQASGAGPEPAAPERRENTDVVLALSAAERESMGLLYACPEPMTWTPEVRVFGRVLHDPAATTVLSSPFAGRLRASGTPLVLGTELEAGQELFRLAPRWTPQELAGLEERRAIAAADRAVAEAEVPALRLALERARGLNAADESVSDREVEEAEARVRLAEARIEGARALQAALSGVAGELPLFLARGGTAVEILAHDGEEVDAGRELVRVEDLRSPLIQLDLPLIGPSLTGARSARIEPADGGESIPAVRLGLAPSAGSGGLAPALLFRIEPGADSSCARPGQSVLAWLPKGEAGLRGVRVRDEAVVRLGGRAFVYARRGDDGFARVPLELDQPVPGGWFVTSLDPAVELVVQGAQSVLSFELLGRQGAEEGD